MSIFVTAASDARAAMESATTLIDNAITQAQSVITVSSAASSFEAPAITFEAGDLSTFEGLYELPDFDAEIELTDLPYPDALDLPSAPTRLSTSSLFNDVKPRFDVDDDLVSPNVNIPDLPDDVVVNLPQLEDSAPPDLDVPDITAPSFTAAFDGVAPDEIDSDLLDIEARVRSLSPEILTQMESFAQAQLTQWCPEYDSAMSLLEQKIAAAMQGDTAITDAIEQQMFDRSRDRAASEKHAMDSQASEALSRRGFTIPPAALQSALDAAQARFSQFVAGAAADVAIGRAELELNHLQFTMNLSSNMRIAMVQTVVQAMANAIGGITASLDIARTAGQLAVEVYNAEVDLYRAKADVYRARADVYRTELEAAFADLRVFEARIEAERLKVDLDRNAIETYQAKIEAERTKVQLYVSQVDAVQSIAAAEATKIDLFRSQVQAFAARVQGKEAELGVYRASIEGDMGKVEAYNALVSSYREEVEAVSAKADADASHAEIVTAYNRSLVELYEASVRKYQVDMEAQGRKFDTERDAYLAAVDAYRANIERERERNALTLQASEQVLSHVTSNGQWENDVNIAAARLKESANETAAEMAMTGAGAYASMASASYGTINLSVYEESN